MNHYSDLELSDGAHTGTFTLMVRVHCIHLPKRSLGKVALMYLVCSGVLMRVLMFEGNGVFHNSPHFTKDPNQITV